MLVYSYCRGSINIRHTKIDQACILCKEGVFERYMISYEIKKINSGEGNYSTSSK